MSGEEKSEFGKVAAIINDASKQSELSRLDNACAALIEMLNGNVGAIEETHLVDLLKTLKKDRRFSQIKDLAEAFIKLGFCHARIYCIYAQALIDTNMHIPAVGILQEILSSMGDKGDQSELMEILGLLGRSWKDIAYEAIDRSDKTVAQNALQNAYMNYQKGLDIARKNKETLAWHGVNLIALEHLAMRGNITLVDPAHPGLAEEILAKIEAEETNDLDVWDYATAAELLVSLDRIECAKPWLENYLGHKNLGLFELISTTRQLDQIWNIRGRKGGEDLYGLLLGKTVTMQGGLISESPDKLRTMDAHYQALHGEPGGNPITELRYAMTCAQSVALIRSAFKPIGTGFVLNASEFGLDCDQSHVILTNSHVVSEPPDLDASKPEDAQITFELDDDKRPYRIKKILWSSPHSKHDCSILELDRQLPDTIKPLTVGELPLNIDEETRAYVIGHPYGQEVTFSLQNSKILAIEEGANEAPQRMHYRSPTDFGNSGSPVFDKNWRAIGIHHSGGTALPKLNGRSGTYAANEGISLRSVIAATTEK